MNNLLSFGFDGSIYQFTSIDALKFFIHEYAQISRQLGDDFDREVDLVKRQTFLGTLAEVTQLIWRAGNLLNQVEARLCPSGTESDGGEL